MLAGEAPHSQEVLAPSPGPPTAQTCAHQRATGGSEWPQGVSVRAEDRCARVFTISISRKCV